MRWLIQRELVAIARSASFWVAASAHVISLAAFVIVWGAGLPVQGGGDAFDQFAVFDTVLLSVLLPWTALRAMAPGGRAPVVALALTTAAPPARLAAARCLGMAVALAFVVSAGLPFALVVQQVATRSPAETAIMLGSTTAYAAVAAVAATFASMLIPGRVLAWAAATVVVRLVALVPPGVLAILTSIALSIAGAALTARWADAHVRYMPEDDPAGREA